MARIRRTARKRLPRGASTTAVLREYSRYRPCYGDSVGKFLLEFRRLWEHAHERGVSHFDGVMRLVDILPSDWTGYAREISGDFIYRQRERYDLEADLPRFVARLLHVHGVYGGRAPYGPYLPPREYTERDTSVEWLYQQIPRDASPGARAFQQPDWRHDCTAGPSTPRALEMPRMPAPGFVPLFPEVPLVPPPPIRAIPCATGGFADPAAVESIVRAVFEMMDAGYVPPARNEHDDPEEEEDPEEDSEEEMAESSPSVNGGGGGATD